MTASSATSARELWPSCGYTCATFLSGAVARSVFNGYREAYVARIRPSSRSVTSLAYLALVACAERPHRSVPPRRER